MNRAPSLFIFGASVEDVGLEPTTPGLQSRCSSRLSQSPRSGVVPGRLELPTPTLSVWCSNRLSYGTPCSLAWRPGRACALQACPASTREREEGDRRRLPPGLQRPLQKGGVPAAPSGTATLLRLSPSHHVRPRQGPTPTSGARGSHGLTGGVYKARERIHRAMADARLLAIPASRGRVAAPDPY